MRESFKRAICVILCAVMVVGTLVATSVETKAATGYEAVFDATYYASKYPDLQAVYGTDANALLTHFVNHGMAEGRQGNAEFNVQAYKARYADLQAAFGDNLKAYYLHYINTGKAEGRNGKADAPAQATATTDSAKPYCRTDSDVAGIVSSYRSSYDEGYYFHNNMTYVWKGGIRNLGKGQEAFCFRISDAAFNDLPARTHTDLSQLRNGDIIHMNDDKHVVIVINAYDTYAIIAEVNQEHVHWDQYVTKDELQRNLNYIITRYPQ